MIKYFSYAVLAALVMVSCNQISDDDIEIVKVQKQLSSDYKESFEETFGEIDPEQAWGFDVDYSASTRLALTRGYSVNGNQWPLEGFVAPTNITADEVEKVKAEFAKKRVNYKNTLAIPYSDFYVQQVYKGDSAYYNADGGYINPASDHMDHLDIYDGNYTYQEWYPEIRVVEGGYMHINNFNNGNNTTVYYQDGTGNPFIGTTLLMNIKHHESPDSLFRYHNTEDSKYHYEYIILKIDGDYYVGFDFYANDDDAQTCFRVRRSDKNADEVVYVDGIWKSVEEAYEAGVEVTFTETVYEWVVDSTTWQGHNNIYDKKTTLVVGTGGTWSIDNYVHGNMWVERDWVFDDWIIKIAGAAEGDDDDDEVVANRIMSEDLGSIGDFDFNDVVFDVVITDGTAKVTLQAAGGTMPIYIMGKTFDKSYEAHELFGVDVKTMVNTGSGVSKNPVTFYLYNVDSVDDIQVYVTNTKQNNATYEVGAEKGEAPQKINVPSTVDWPKERVSIETTYPKFSDWVSDHTQLFWE